MSRLLCMIGTPSPKLYAVQNIVRALVQTTIGEHMVVVANSIDALREKFPDSATRNNRPVLLMSDYPNPDLTATLYDLNAPVVVCVDDFTTVALSSVVSRGFTGVDAARFATMGLVNVEPTIVSPAPSALFVRSPEVETLRSLVAELAAFYRLPMKDDSVTRVLKFIGFDGQEEAALGEYINREVASLSKTAEDGRAALEKRSPLENELIDFLAPQYDAVVEGRPLETLEWPVYALVRPEFPDRLTVGPIDLTGPARHIYFGPYFALPAGSWSAEIALEVQDCYSDNQIAVDVFADGILSIVRAQLPPKGVYGCQIQFEIEDPSKPVEIRMQLLTGAIEGVIQLHRIAIHRLNSLDEPNDDAA
jgi:hypothetical protein